MGKRKPALVFCGMGVLRRGHSDNTMELGTVGYVGCVLERQCRFGRS